MKFNSSKSNKTFIKNFIIFLFLNTSIYSISQISSNNQSSLLSKNNIAKISEKIFLHTDRIVYAVGENILFKASYTNNIDYENLVISKVLYIDIVNHNGQIISTNKYAINKNSAYGSIEIPENAKSGLYTIRAYTNWQKNFGTFYFFKQYITIINHTKDIYLGSSNKFSKKVKTVHFFPEGGKLISNQNNLIAFRVYNEIGEQIDTFGKVLDSDGNIISVVKTVKNGLGYFNLSPKNGYSYELLIENTDGSEIRFKLPIQITRSVEIKFDNSDEQLLFLNIKSEKGKCENCQFTIEIANNGLAYNSFKDKLYKGVCLIKLNKNELPEGLNQLIIYDKNQLKLYERLFYNSPKNRKRINVNTNKHKYKNREKVICEINLNGGPVGLKKAILSVSVAKKKLSNFSHNTSLNFENNFNINDSSISTDSYFLSIDYQDNSKTSFYIPETRGISLRGKLINTKSNSLVANRLIYLSTIGEPSIIQNSRTNNKGEFIFSLDHYYGKKDFSVQLSSTEDISDIDIVIENDRFFRKTSIGNKNLDPKNYPFYQDMVTSYLIAKKFKDDKTPFIEKHNESSFFDKPDKVYLMKDYVDMPTMGELLFEIIDEVVVEKNRDNFEIIVLRKKNDPLSLKPLILIDGFPVFNIKNLFKINPSEIKKIELINTEYILGDITYGGIISFTSLNTDFAGLKIPKNAIFFELPLLSKQEQYIVKEYSSENIEKRIPDYRNTLYWNHGIEMDENGKCMFSFFTSDESGNYLIDVRGLDSNGDLISGSGEFTVN